MHTKVFSARHVQHERVDITGMPGSYQQIPKTVGAKTCHDCTQLTGYLQYFRLAGSIPTSLISN